MVDFIVILFSITNNVDKRTKGQIRKDNEEPFLVHCWLTRSQSETDVSSIHGEACMCQYYCVIIDPSPKFGQNFK